MKGNSGRSPSGSGSNGGRSIGSAATGSQSSAFLLLAGLLLTVFSSVAFLTHRQSSSSGGIQPYYLLLMQHYCGPSFGGTAAASGSRVVEQKSSSTTPGDNTGTGSSLFPHALELWKSGVDLSQVYPYSKFPDPSKSKNNKKKKVVQITITTDENDADANVKCDCTDPLAGWDCCERLIRRGHKMGIQMTERLFADDYSAQIKTFWHQWEYRYLVERPVVDYRNVIVLRNIYDALLSGYLYHLRGSECTVSQFGEPDPNMLWGRKFLEVQLWQSYLDYDVEWKQKKGSSNSNSTVNNDVQHDNNDNFCQYLAESSEEDGMRAYVAWVFRAHYHGLLEHWALAQALPSVTQRTMTVCYEDLSTAERDSDLNTIDAVLGFLYDGPYNHKPYMGHRPGKSDAGGHATTKDPALRRRLAMIVRSLDREYYGGSIAWLDSVLPC